MHVHASDSEGAGSWESQLSAAVSLGVTYVHPSDHDWRIDATNRRFGRKYDFAAGLNDWLTWGATRSGTASGSARIVRIADGGAFDGRSALQLRISGNGSAARRGLRVTNTHTNLEGNVRGRRISGDLLIRSGVLEIRVSLSRHLGGPLTLRYRLGSTQARSTSISATEVEVDIPTAIGTWTDFDVSPMTDLARHWPSLDVEDNSITGIELAALSNGGDADVFLPALHLPRDVVGTNAVEMHNAMIQRLRNRTGQAIGHALEYSWDATPAHLNGFYPNGPAGLLPQTHPYVFSHQYPKRVAEAVHALGGIVSLNHPTGASFGLAPPSEQAQVALTTARTLIAHRLYDVDLIELGYRARGDLSLENLLLRLGAMLWRDGWFFTANGVSDDHTGIAGRWSSQPGITHAWAPASTLSAQLAALRAGRAHVTMWTAYRGKLWLALNDAPMGSVQVNPDSSGRDTVLVAATDLPAGAKVTVYRGLVDYPGESVSGPGLAPVSEPIPASAFAAGPVELQVRREESCYYLAVASKPEDSIIGFTNPGWGLQAINAARPVPADRLVR